MVEQRLEAPRAGVSKAPRATRKVNNIMGLEQYNVTKECPKCDCTMIRMLSHPTFICFACKHEEVDEEDRGDYGE